MKKLKEKSPGGTILSTLALITVLFEDVVEAVNIHNTLIYSDDPQDPWPDVILMNRTGTFGGFAFEGGIIKNEEYSPLQKELLKLLEGLCIFGNREYNKNCCVLWLKLTRPFMGLTPQFQKNSWKCSI